VKGFGVVLFVVLASAALAGCGGDNTTTFVLDSGSPTASASAKASASAAATASVAASSSTLPSTVSATPIAGNQKIIIDSPDASTTISSPVQVSGTASVDKGTVVGVVLDAAGNELGRATATASAVKPDYGHYDLTISFTGAASGTKGQIKVFGVSPRDGTTPTSYYFITIKFS
jgi:hypothetical protein